LKSIRATSVRLRTLVRRKSETARVIAAGCNEAAKQYEVARGWIWWRFLRLYARRFSPREIFLWGLLDPERTGSDLAGYISKESLLRIQNFHNPASHINLVEDKVVFHAQCAGLGLPVPRAFVILTRSGAWLAREAAFVEWSTVVEHMKTLREDYLIVKPGNGVYGHGVRLVGRDSDGQWIDQSGRTFDEEGFRAYCDEQSAYDRFLLQERIHNHPEIIALTGLATLQTVRVITVSGGDGAPGEIVLANWRIAGHEGVTDNFDYGQGSSMLAAVDTGTGRIQSVVGAKRNGNGIREVQTHPVTGAPLVDFALPHWDAVREVICTATAHFAPLRLVGWDIALAQDGPVLIEANARFDAGQNAFRALPRLIRKIHAEGR